MEYFSQYGQDKFLDEKVFDGKKNGFFVDFGAHDGMTLSNSLFFEKYRQWSGICIEPIPEVYEKLKQNRKCITVNGCISLENGISKFLRVDGYGEMYSGLIDKYDPLLSERIQRDLKVHGGATREIEVQCYNLNELLKKHQICEVDYCSIDTEGGEFEILQSIDFKSIEIKVFTVENNFNSPEPRKFMASKGYNLIYSLTGEDFYQLARKKSFWKFW